MNDAPLLAPVIVPPDFRIIAHRGASGYAPENTMAAFALAKKMGAREVELDVQFSKDRHLMICHDPGLERYGHPGKTVAGLSREELQALDMGSWFDAEKFADERMITLAELFTAFKKDFIYHVELKKPAPGLAEKVRDCILAHHLEARVFVTSFDFDALAAFIALDTDIPFGWLTRAGGFTEENVRRAADAGCSQFCPIARDVTQENVAHAHEKIREIRAHTVPDRETMIRVIEAGCDGFTINWPDWLTYGN